MPCKKCGHEKLTNRGSCAACGFNETEVEHEARREANHTQWLIHAEMKAQNQCITRLLQEILGRLEKLALPQKSEEWNCLVCKCLNHPKNQYCWFCHKQKGIEE